MAEVVSAPPGFRDHKNGGKYQQFMDGRWWKIAKDEFPEVTSLPGIGHGVKQAARARGLKTSWRIDAENQVIYIKTTPVTVGNAIAEAKADTKAEAQIKTIPRAPRSVTVPESFEQFWRVYPRKTGKGDALKAWVKLSPSLVLVLAALDWQTKQAGWVKDGGQFVPHPTTWLNRRGWEDEPFHVAPKTEVIDRAQPEAESWSTECRRLHGRSCGHRAAHALKMERDHAV